MKLKVLDLPDGTRTWHFDLSEDEVREVAMLLLNDVEHKVKMPGSLVLLAFLDCSDEKAQEMLGALSKVNHEFLGAVLAERRRLSIEKCNMDKPMGDILKEVIEAEKGQYKRL